MDKYNLAKAEEFIKNILSRHEYITKIFFVIIELNNLNFKFA